MSISDYLEAAVLNEVLRNTNLVPVATVYLSLHTADPLDTGGSEVAGGSYARQAIAFGAPAAGVCTNSANIEFATMPATTVTHFGIWDAASSGNLLLTGPIGSATLPLKGFSAKGSTDLLTVTAHGYAAQDRVEVTAEFAGSLPSGLAEGTLYFVSATGLTADAFSLSLTSGGAVIDIGDGTGLVFKVVPQQTLAGNTFRVQAAQLSVKVA